MAVEKIKTGMSITEAIDTTNSNFESEITERISGDEAVKNDLDAEISDRISSDEELKDLISEEVSDRQLAVEQVTSEVSTVKNRVITIESKIPAQATSSNKLADKDFVNSSISHMAANKVTYNANGDGFPTYEDLIEALVYYHKGEPYTPNDKDYAIVIADETAPAPYTNGEVRYEYDGEQWTFAFGINERPFTSDERKALDSGITTEKVADIDKKADIYHYLSDDYGEVVDVTSEHIGQDFAKVNLTDCNFANYEGKLTFSSGMYIDFAYSGPPGVVLHYADGISIPIASQDSSYDESIGAPGFPYTLPEDIGTLVSVDTQYNLLSVSFPILQAADCESNYKQIKQNYESIEQLDSGKLDKNTTTGSGDRVYTVSNNGVQGVKNWAQSPSSGSLAARRASGALAVGTAIYDDEAVPKAQFNEAVDKKADKYQQELPLSQITVGTNVGGYTMVADSTAYVSYMVEFSNNITIENGNEFYDWSTEKPTETMVILTSGFSYTFPQGVTLQGISGGNTNLSQVATGLRFVGAEVDCEYNYNTNVAQQTQIDELYDSNIKNGNAVGSLAQRIYTDDSKNAKATGVGSVAFGGYRADKPDGIPDDEDTVSTANGIQSLTTGAGNASYGDWSFTSGKDNKAYQRSSHALGNANIVGRTKEEFDEYWRDNGGVEYPISGVHDIWGAPYERSYLFAFAAGQQNLVLGRASAGIGSNLIVNAPYQIAVGTANEVDDNAKFLVGVGELNADTGEVTRANGFQVDNNGYTHAYKSPIPDDFDITNPRELTSEEASRVVRLGDLVQKQGILSTKADIYTEVLQGTQEHPRGYGTVGKFSLNDIEVGTDISGWTITGGSLASTFDGEPYSSYPLSGSYHFLETSNGLWIGSNEDDGEGYGGVLYVGGTAWWGLGKWVTDMNLLSYTFPEGSIVTSMNKAYVFDDKYMFVDHKYISADCKSNYNAIQDHEMRITALEGASGGIKGYKWSTTFDESAIAVTAYCWGYGMGTNMLAYVHPNGDTSVKQAKGIIHYYIDSTKTTVYHIDSKYVTGEAVTNSASLYYTSIIQGNSLAIYREDEEPGPATKDFTFYYLVKDE